jgi:hypothetical protein
MLLHHRRFDQKTLCGYHSASLASMGPLDCWKHSLHSHCCAYFLGEASTNLFRRLELFCAGWHQRGRDEAKPANHPPLALAEAQDSKLDELPNRLPWSCARFRARYPAMINSFSAGISAICCLAIFM